MWEREKKTQKPFKSGGVGTRSGQGPLHSDNIAYHGLYGRNWLTVEALRQSKQSQEENETTTLQPN